MFDVGLLKRSFPVLSASIPLAWRSRPDVPVFGEVGQQGGENLRHPLGGRAGLRYVFQGVRIEFVSHLVTVSDACLSERAAIMNKCDTH